VAVNWAALAAGRSGIRRITRFPLDHLRTTIAGCVDLPEDRPGAPLSSVERVERMAVLAARFGTPGAPISLTTACATAAVGRGAGGIPPTPL